MSAEQALIDALSDDYQRKLASVAFLEKLKTSGPVWDTIKGGAKGLGSVAKSTAVQNKAKIIAGLAGAGVGAAGGYLLSKPGKDGKPSIEQDLAKKKLKNIQSQHRENKKTGKEPSFRESLNEATAPVNARVADVLAKHPGKAALLAAPMGAASGLTILKALRFAAGLKKAKT